MPARSLAASCKRLPHALLGMFALVIGVEFWIGRAGGLETGAAACWRATGAAARAEARDASVLCFGDSMVKFGVIPRVLEAEGTLPAYNLGLHAGPPAASYYLLKRALEAGARPRIILVNFAPHQLAAGPDREELARPWSELLDPVEAFDLATRLGDAELLGRLAVARAVPSVRSRHEIQTWIQATLQGRAWSARRRLEALHRNWQSNKGAQVLACNAGPVSIDLTNMGLFPERWGVDPQARRDVDRFLRLALGTGARVYWLMTPFHSDAQALRMERGLSEAYDRFAREILTEFPELAILDARDSNLGEGHMADMVHLDRAGALRLSRALASALQGRSQSRVVARRWIHLQDQGGNETALSAAIEDLDESALSLWRERGNRVR